jgi:hypothetical protein
MSASAEERKIDEHFKELDAILDEPANQGLPKTFGPKDLLTTEPSFDVFAFGSAGRDNIPV